MSERTTGQSFPGPIGLINAALARNWWVFVLRGVLGVIFGVIAFAYPGSTMLSLVIVFSAYAFADGILSIIAGVRAAQQKDSWGYLVLSGVVSIVAAVAAVVWPTITVITFVVLVAFWALFGGGLMLAAAAQLNIDHGRWWLVLGGIASLIYGVLLIISPLTGALVLTWWIGAYALVLGISLIVLGIKLKSFAPA